MGRTLGVMGRRRILRLAAALAVAVASLAVPAVASAHPLGNFTINHYAGLTVATDRIDLDVVIDMAEIPTFQERQTMDSDEDGSVSDEEVAAWAPGACGALAPSLHLSRDGASLVLAAGSAAASFAPGAGGLSTLRLECGYAAALTAPITAATAIAFHDDSYAERIGWREIVATARGTILDTHGLPTVSPSQKLTAYPADQIATPLDIRSAAITARPDPAVAMSSTPPVAPPAAPAGPVAAAPSQAAAVPGGVAAELPSIFRATDLTAIVVLGSIGTAVAIGALHALTPGHGKTLMAAYLVGTRGTAVHAVGLGLSVAVSHTLGILVLALLVVGAGSALPPDVVYRVTPVIAGVSIVAIGGWMLVAEVRRRRGAAAHARAHEHDHDHDHDHEHEHDQGRAGVHSHGGVRHSHLPDPGRTLTWRSLFVLGLAGGLIPSTSALIILLGAIAAGRPAFGLVLVMAFGIGMAAVMTGVGLAMIVARARLDRMPTGSSLGRLAAAAPLLASIAVLVLGSWLTWQAVAGAPVL
jgi:ABC-type nickel/cobalt efflux system permease component RcnA